MGAIFTTPFALAVGAASNLFGVMSKFNVVFGEHADDAKKWSDSFAEHIGRSKRQIAQFMAQMQTLFVPLGFDEDTATRMSKQVTQLAVDLASFNNAADADVIRDLDSALTGNGQVMKKYHVILNEAAVKQELFNRGMDPKNATDQQKVMARLAIIMRATATAQGDAARNTGRYANQKKALAGRIEDLRGALAGGLLPELAEYYGWITKLVGGLVKWVKENQAVVIWVAKVAVGLTAAGAVIYGVGRLLGGMSAALGGVAWMVKVVTGAFSLAGIAIGAIVSPIGLVSVAVVGLAAYFLHASGSIRVIVDWLGDVFGRLKEDAMKAFGGIADALKAEDIKLAAKILWAFLKLEWLQGVNWLTSYWEDFKQFFIDTGWTSAFMDALAAIKTAWVETISFLQRLWVKFDEFLNSDEATTKYRKWQNEYHRKTKAFLGQFDDPLSDIEVPDFRTYQERLDDIDQEARDRNQQIESDRWQSQTDLANNKAGRAKRAAAAQAALAEARADMDALVAKAKGAAAAKGPGVPDLEPPPGLGDGVPTAKEIARTAVGTFSAAQAALYGGPNPQQQLVALAKRGLSQRQIQVQLDRDALLELKRISLEATA
ncbi:MAG TPA: hypothetical protein ENH80_04400 [Phycisphaerae bacterium]|nr:hypothetical protein [Phycisphaerae bacterium]